jgi:hypothetical protein
MMKLLFAILVVFLFSCSKGSNEASGNYFGYGKATINGAQWDSKARGFLLDGKPDSVVLVFENMQGDVTKDDISFYKVSTQLIRQKVGKMDFSNLSKRLAARYAVMRPDGIIVCTLYNVLEQDSLLNNITITSYDSATKEIKGTFEVSFLMDTTLNKSCNPGALDTVRVRNGEFHTKIF